MNREVHLILENIPFFKGISPEATAAVSQRLVPRAASAGTILFRRGEAPRGVYILVEGEVEIYRVTSVDSTTGITLTDTPLADVTDVSYTLYMDRYSVGTGDLETLSSVSLANQAYDRVDPTTQNDVVTERR